VHAARGSCYLQRRVSASSHCCGWALLSVRVTGTAIPLWEAAESPSRFAPLLVVIS